jgi:hypothetical protein
MVYFLAGSAFHSDKHRPYIYYVNSSVSANRDIYYINPETLDVNFIYEGGSNK